ncbi:DNA-binding IclR family transcriptional regulator [Neorhizobium galegae]|nr:DNA-binding IclR family transcriptional regulator [Neorhizobium galegae]
MPHLSSNADRPDPAELDPQNAAGDTGTLGKAVALLDLVARADMPPRFTDLLKQTGQPRGSLHRQLRHLVLEGLIDLSPDGVYTPGLRLLQFASRAWARNSFRLVAEPHLTRLHETTGETVHLGVLRDCEIVYLDKIESRQAVRMHSQVGNSAPAYCTGVGKVSLSCLSDEDLHRRCARMTFDAYTQATLTDAAALLAEIEKIRSRGFAYDLEEHQPGIRCVAASIHAPAAGIVGGISVTAPAFRAGPEQLEAWAGPVCAAASAIVADIARRLGPRR